jgi:hypothetical protein
VTLNEFYDWCDNQDVEFIDEIDFKAWGRLIKDVPAEDRTDAAVYYQVTRGYVELITFMIKVTRVRLEREQSKKRRTA